MIRSNFCLLSLSSVTGQEVVGDDGGAYDDIQRLVDAPHGDLDCFVAQSEGFRGDSCCFIPHDKSEGVGGLERGIGDRDGGLFDGDN